MYKSIKLFVNNFDKDRIEFLEERLGIKTKAKILRLALDLLYLVSSGATLEETNRFMAEHIFKNKNA